MYYVIFGIGEAALHRNLFDWFWGVRCSSVECLYFVFLTNISLDSVFLQNDLWFSSDDEHELCCYV